MCLKKKKKIKLSLDKVENLFHVSAFLLCHVLFQNWKMTFLKWKLVLVLQETACSLFKPPTELEVINKKQFIGYILFL